ncbi:MAG: serine/threonine protein kinase [Planctomycetaceae bacterium]|nr:serine/threonine protein kinase [Planctomycetaceae bacterium]
MKMKSIPFVFALGMLASFASSLHAADWPRFRGPGGSGASADTGLPTTWSAAENIVWKQELPGYGASSPITWGERIFLTGYSGYGEGDASPGDRSELKQHVVCLDRKSGKILWDKTSSVAQGERDYERFVALHGFASATPVTDGKGVFASFGSSGVYAYNLDGKKRWHAEVGSKTNGFGTATSPIVYENLVIVNASVEARALIAFDKTSGDEVWRAEGVNRSWNTPILVENPRGKTELVVSVQGKVRAFNPATGDSLWDCEAANDYICPSPIAHDGVVYAFGGRTVQMVAIRTGGAGDVTGTHRLWSQSCGSNVSSPVFHAGKIYWLNHSGIAHVVDAATGEIEEQRRVRGTGRVYASAVLADGKIYCVSRDKGTFVFEADPEFEQIAHNTIAGDDSIFNATPAVSNGQLLMRSDTYLYCIGQ